MESTFSAFAEIAVSFERLLLVKKIGGKKKIKANLVISKKIFVSPKVFEV